MSKLLIGLMLVYSINLVYSNRLPLEIYAVPDSKHQQIQTNHDNENHTKHKLKLTNEQRHSRALQQNVQVNHRILYQVGNSEDDLPICQPNAVCSKIDLYETPWLERQCRCPRTSQRRIHIIYHPKDKDKLSIKLKQSNQQQQNQQYLNDNKLLDFNLFDDDKNDDMADQLTDSTVRPPINSLNDDGGDEPQHHKDLLRKLGVFHSKDDIIDDQEIDNSFYPFNRRPIRRNYYEYNDGKKLRHSGHHVDVPTINGCPTGLGAEDGHTIVDKTRHYKLCEPIHTLPICRYFRDYTWELTSSPEMNVTEQIVNCICPKNSITYLIKREPLTNGKLGYTYFFACSPQSRLRCQRKEPCKLFTVRKRLEYVDEVNTNPLCQCPRAHRCPTHHTDIGVLPGKSYTEDNINTYSGYCVPIDNN